MRIGDAERERTARALREHCAAGRLSLDELEHRLAAAYAAVTDADLAALERDLPTTAPTVRAPERGAVLWWPGVAAFHVTRRLRGTPSEVFDDALRGMVPRMALRGFRLVDDVVPRRLLFVAAGGLDVTVLLLPADAGTELSAFGRAPYSVREAFATLSD